jgi:hypothetical protein
MQEQETTECCPDLQAKLQEWRECTEKTLQDEPLKVAGYAFAAGVVCAVFPVGWCLGMLVRVSLSLLRPALFIFGLVKLFEEIERRRDPSRREMQDTP